MTAITVETLLQNLIDYKKLAYENDLLDDNDGECKQIAFDLCKSEIESKAQLLASETAKREETPEAFLRSLEANLQIVSDSTVEQCARYKTFLNDLKDVHEQQKLINEEALKRRSLNASRSVVHSGDGEVQMDMQISDMDPITKKPLEKPCRNKMCGHVYGLDSVTQSLQLNPRMRCPIVGCANKSSVTLQMLVLDKDLERQLVVQRAAKK